MKKLILVGILAFFVLSPNSVSAQGDLFFNEKHNYQVLFKENKEAIVFARIVFTNKNSEPQTSYKFTSDNGELQELSVLQVKLPQQCAEYSSSNSYQYQQSSECARYIDANYNDYYSSSATSKEAITFAKAAVTNDSLTYTVTLPNPVETDKSSGLLIAYTSKVYVDNSMLKFNYHFPTLKIDSRIGEARIGVSVDTKLVLAGADGGSSYDYGCGPGGLCSGSAESVSSKSGSSRVNEPFTDRNLDDLYNSIVQDGQKIETANSVTPNNSYYAKGSYATSTFRLNFVQATLIIAIMLITLISAIVGLILWRRKHPKIAKTTTVAGQSELNANQKWQSIHLLRANIIILGLASVALIILTTWLITSDSFEEVLIADTNFTNVLLALGIFALYIVLVALLPVVYAVKYGKYGFLSMIISQFSWMALLSVIFIPIMMLF